MVKGEFITIVRLWSFISTLLLSVVLYVTFLSIFLTEKKAIYVAVNDYGEGLIELIIFSITLFLAFIGYFSLLKDKSIFRSSE
jgi:ribose/xylose/arabinose/galactoside ABC-type transport system permease subunit